MPYAAMEIIFNGNKSFQKYWEAAVAVFANITIGYSPLIMEYAIHYSGKRFKENISFVVIDGKQYLALCPLFIENVNNINQFSSANDYLRSPLIDCSLQANMRKIISKFIIKNIDELALRNKVLKYKVMIDPLTQKLDSEQYNWLMRYGYIDASINTNIINLKETKEMLWSHIRKGHKHNIKQGRKYCKVAVWDYSNPDYEKHELYRLMHHKVSGRITRSLRTFELQYDCLKNDEAILIGLFCDNKWIAFGCFVHLNKKAIYSSSVQNPEELDISVPLGHLMIWTAIEYYNNREFDLLEIGWQHYSTQIFDHPSKKEIDVSLFKRGFGGKTYPLFRGIKYYDREYMKKDIDDHVRKLCINSI